MKYYETTCAEYIAASKRADMHPELASFNVDVMPESLSELGNIILYGPSGVGKYTQFLRFVEKYAVNGIKTEKMTAATDKQTYEYHISDIHYEIDLALLGCESKKLWNECFFQIVDVVSAKKSKCGIILCKNFQSIHSELLDVFYSYMQHCRALSIHIVFVLLTEHVSFIPNRILQCCKLIPVKRPSAELYKESNIHSQRTGGAKSHKTFLQKIHPSSSNTMNMFRRDVDAVEFAPEFLLNMKEMHLIAKVDAPPKDVFNIVCDNIIAKMIDHENIDIISFRDNLYDILLYGLDVTECLWYILYHFVENGIFVEDEKPDGLCGSKRNVRRMTYVSPPTACASETLRHSYETLLVSDHPGSRLTPDAKRTSYAEFEDSISEAEESFRRELVGRILSEMMDKTDAFLKFYNNNYRPIYHLESMFIYLITKIYRYPSKSNELKTRT